MADLGRIYRLTTIRAPELFDIATKGRGNGFFEELETVTEFVGQTESDHNLEFHVERNLWSTPNTCDLVIYNLAEPSRQAYTDGPVKVRLEAGYDGLSRLMFLGDLRYCSNELDGTVWKTKLQLADGARAYAHARVNKAYAKGTPLNTIIGDICKSFGVPMPPVSRDLSIRIAGGETVTGNAADELDRLLAPFGFSWSFQHGALQILKVGDAVSGVAIDISEDDGMISAPEMVPPKIIVPRKVIRHRATATPHRPRVPRLKVKHLLYPEVSPGSKINVRSRSINGIFRVDVVRHKGSLFGPEWTTEIEATATADKEVT